MDGQAGFSREQPLAPREGYRIATGMDTHLAPDVPDVLVDRARISFHLVGNVLGS